MEWLESTTSAVRRGFDCQQSRQKASVPIAQEQGVARAGQMRELGTTAAPEPGPEAQVFQPSVGAGDAIEVDVAQCICLYAAAKLTGQREQGQRRQQRGVGGDAQMQRVKGVSCARPVQRAVHC